MYEHSIWILNIKKYYPYELMSIKIRLMFKVSKMKLHNREIMNCIALFYKKKTTVLFVFQNNSKIEFGMGLSSIKKWGRPKKKMVERIQKILETREFVESPT